MSTTDADQHDPDAYAAAAVRATAGNTACCDPGITYCCTADTTTDGNAQVVFGPDLYQRADRDQLPAEAVAASLGCGNPLAVADLHPR